MNIMDVSMKTDQDHLRVLGLDLNVTSDDIKDAWRTMLKVWHPDRFHGDEDMRRKAEQKTKEINAAYQALEGYKYTPPRVESRPPTQAQSHTQTQARPSQARPSTPPVVEPTKTLDAFGGRSPAVAAIFAILAVPLFALAVSSLDAFFISLAVVVTISLVRMIVRRGMGTRMKFIHWALPALIALVVLVFVGIAARIGYQAFENRGTHFRGPDDHPATSAQISQIKVVNGSLSATPEPVTGGPENNKLSNGYEFDGYIQNNLTVEISFIRMKITIFDCPEVPMSDTYDPSPPSDCKNIGSDEEDDFPHAAPGESVGFSNFHFAQRPLSSLRWNYEITEMDTEKASSPGPAPKPEDVYYREQQWPGASRDYTFPDGGIITTPAGYALINDDDGTPAQFNKDGFIYVNQSKFVVTVKNHVGKEVTSTGACVAWSEVCGIVQPTPSGVPSLKSR